MRGNDRAVVFCVFFCILLPNIVSLSHVYYIYAYRDMLSMAFLI